MSQSDSDPYARWQAARLAPLWNSPNAHKPPPAPVATQKFIVMVTP